MNLPLSKLTPDLARDWLLANDKEGANLWTNCSEEGLVEAVRDNLNSFGYENQSGQLEICKGL